MLSLGVPPPDERPVVLVLRALGLGDLLTGVPALSAVRRAFADHLVVLAAPHRLIGPAAATGLIDAMVPTSAPGRAVPGRLVWAGPPPEVAVDLHGCGRESIELLQSVRPGRLLAYAHPSHPEVDGPQWHPDEHERHRWCRLLDWYGIAADPDEVSIPRPLDPGSPGAVVIHPGADAGSRRWPPERFAAVAAAVHAAGREVVITAGAGEHDLGYGVAADAGLPRSAVLAAADPDDDVPFEQLAAVVASAGAVVCGDTGLSHLATALRAPSVTLFGPVSPSLWGPPDDPRHRVLWHPGPPGDPHGDSPDPQLLRIGVDDVLAELDALGVVDTAAATATTSRYAAPRPVPAPRS